MEANPQRPRAAILKDKTMTYDFSETITPILLETINAMLPAGITLRGVAVEQSATDEGALIQWEGSMTAYVAQDAAIWSSIVHDAQAIYMGYIADMQIEQDDPTVH